MKPPNFHYFAPTALEDALVLLAQHGAEARILAGGQSLVPQMNMRRVRPATLIDINRIANLAYVQPTTTGIAIGALTRTTTLEHDALIGSRQPLIAEAARYIGYPAIRNRGTLGGSLAHADPNAELPPVMLALNAEIEVRQHGSSRTITAANFFQGPAKTSLTTGELISEVRIPDLPPGAGSAFIEVSRREGGYAIVGVAAVVVLNADRSIAEARVALCGVGPTPLRATQTEQGSIGQPANAHTWAAAATAVQHEIINPPDDLHGSADYRRHLAAVLVERALTSAAARI
ncbi:xanthine dehydrogenase family protein subunit M [Candidatus Gracilibacteria bacterium]|nr:xanthine dehydrogenase family protein subunit M [Candidatus Gracilibacteria bacterium]